MSRIENFGKNKNSNGLDKNKNNINYKGRPKKGVSLVNSELLEKGYSPATRQDIEENYMSLLQLEEVELRNLLEDKTKPMLIRILIKNMLSGKGFDIIEKMLDRGIGRPKQTEETRLINKDGDDVGINIIFDRPLSPFIIQKNEEGNKII